MNLLHRTLRALSPPPVRFSARHSLRMRLAGIMLLTSTLLILLLVVFYVQSERLLYNEFIRKTAELSKAVRIGLESASAQHLSDLQHLEGYLEQLDVEGIREISVISSSNRIIASTAEANVGKWITERRKELIFKAELGEPVTGDGPSYDVIIPVTSSGATAGYIHLSLDAADFSVFLRTSTVRRILAALVVLALGTLLAMLLAGRYTRPVEQIARAAERVAAGDLEQRLPVERRDEIGVLARSFDHMIAQLREEQELRERLRTAEHLASVGQLARNVAHEIKNPLNFISLSIDHMRDAYRPDDPARAERFESLVRNIKGEVSRIGRFAESYLAYGRPFELRRTLCDPAQLLDDTLDLVAAQAAQHGIALHRDYPRLPAIAGDPELLRTCVLNLVVNAFEAMPCGGALSVRGTAGSEGVELVFADSGVGIPAEQLEKVFDPLVTTKKEGLGLGLALTRRIVEEHGGRIRIASRAGEGTEVSVLLPREERG